MKVEIEISNSLPTGRKRINLHLLLAKRDHPVIGKNPCICVSLATPQAENRAALVKGMHRILPFIYRSVEQLMEILMSYGDELKSMLPYPKSPDHQWAHLGEILTCAYFEECEDTVIFSYKWRLNTARNQHPYGMDLIAFDVTVSPPKIYLVAVKTSHEGTDDKRLAAINNAITELKKYLKGENEKLDDDLEIIAANLHTDAAHKDLFKAWYDPYTQGVLESKPQLIPVPAIVIDTNHWKDDYALPAIRRDFGKQGMVRVLCIDELEKLVRETYSEASS